MSLAQSLLNVTLIILLLFQDSLQHNERDENDIIELVNDFMKNQNYKMRINSFTCWNKGITSKLFKTLGREFHTSLTSFNLDTLNLNFPERQIFLVDSQCEIANEIFQLAFKAKLFDAPFTWLIIDDPKWFSSSNIYLGISSKVFIIMKDELANSFMIKSIYKTSRWSDKFQEDYIGSWTRMNKFQEYNPIMAAKNRSNLMQDDLAISYVLTNLDSLNHLWDYRDRHVDGISKLNFILMHRLADCLNATPKFTLHRTWGYKNATTGIYGGMVGDLQLKISDIAGTPMFVTADRIPILDYVAAPNPTYMKFIFKAPPLSYVTNVFTLPFDRTVWHYSFIMVAVICVCIYVIVIWEWKEPKFRQKFKEESIGNLRPNFFDVVMMEIGAISQQGSDVEPRSYAGRTATIFTFIVLTFMYTSYSANIVALLQSTTDSIRTLEDLLNSRIKLGVEDIVYAHYYFETASEPVQKAIYEQKIVPKGQKSNFMKLEEGIRRVQEGFFGFHVELSTGYKVVGDMFHESEKCSLKEIAFVNLKEPWLTVAKNSPYKKLIKIGMEKIHESGVQQREVRKIYTQKPVCHSKGSNFDSVGMIDCYSAFLIFAIGIGISLVLLVVEIGARKYQEKRLQRKIFKFRDEIQD